MIVRKSCLSTIIAAFSLFVLNPPIAPAAEASAKVSTVAIPYPGQPIVARCDTEGTIHVACNSPDGPQYVRSVDNGKTFSRPLAIVDDASLKPGLEFDVWDMAVGPGGVVHVALGTNAWKLKLPLHEWGYFYARLDDGAKSFSPVRNINRQPSEGFSLAADDQGNVAACWLADKLYVNLSHDNGSSFGRTVEIDPSLNPCNCCTTSSAFAADGRLAILYREESNDDRDMFLVLWDQNGGEVKRTQISSTLWKTDSCPMTYYTVAATRDGFVLVWPTQGQIYFARLGNNGDVLPPGEIKTPGTNGHRTGVLALNDVDGNTLVAWKKDGRLGWQLYDLKGRSVGKPGSIASAGNGAAGVLSKEGTFLLFP